MKQPDSQSVRRIRETLVQDAGASRRITGNAVRSAASRAARRARSAGRGAGGLARDAVEGAVHAVGEIGGETRAFVKDAVIGERLSKVPLA